MSKKSLAHLALLFVNLMYGANYVIAKGVMPDYVAPNAFILMRVIGAVLVFWTIFSFKYEKVTQKDLALLALCGLFGVGMNQLLFFNGLMRTSPINAPIIMTATPIIVFVLSIFFLKEKATWVKWLGILLGAVGSITLTLISAEASTTALGDIFIFLNAISYSVYLILVKPLMKKYKPLTVITWVFTFGLIYVLIWPWSRGEFTEIDWQTMPTDIFWRIVFVIIGVTVLPYLLTVLAMRTISPSVASSYIYLQPVFSGFFVYIFYLLGKEDYTSDFSYWKVPCALLVFFGVYLISKKEKTVKSDPSTF